MKKVINLLIITTFNCNYKCKFCFIGDKLNTVSLDWTHNKIEKLFNDVDFLDDDFLYDIRITGGEPLINIDAIKNILKYIDAKNLYSKILNFSIVTNGLLLQNLEEVNYYLEKLDNKLVIDVSFHGFKDTYSQIVGVSGTWDLVLDNILDAKKKYKNVMVNIVVNQKNIHEIKNLLIFLLKKGIVQFNILYVSFIGYAFDNKQELILNYFNKNIYLEMLYKFTSKLNGLKTNKGTISVVYTINFPNCQLSSLGNNKKRIKDEKFDFIYSILPKYYFKTYKGFDSEEVKKEIYSKNHHTIVGLYSDIKKKILKTPSSDNITCYNCNQFADCNLYTDEVYFVLDKILYENEFSQYSGYFS